MPVELDVDALSGAVHERLLRDGARPVPVALEVGRLVREHSPLLDESAVADVVRRVLARTAGLGPLDPLLADPDVTEVMVNGPGPVWVERGGELVRTAVVVDVETIDRLLERVVAPLGLRLDRTSPVVDARLPDGSRVNAVVPPLAVDGPCLTIRRFGARTIDLDRAGGRGVGAFLGWAVAANANVIVTGGTGAGKTTLLNALAGLLPSSERVVTVEDAAELRLPGEHVVRLEARPANADGLGAIGIRALVRNALRMRPDRIVVGEVRGPEALDMLQAMNTGHEGSLSTCHANGPADALRRLETMVLMGEVGLPLAAVREQVGSALDFVVHVARRAGGERRIVSVGEVDPSGTGVRRLADDRGMIDVPARGARRPGTPPPDAGWVA